MFQEILDGGVLLTRASRPRRGLAMQILVQLEDDGSETTDALPPASCLDVIRKKLMSNPVTAKLLHSASLDGNGRASDENASIVEEVPASSDDASSGEDDEPALSVSASADASPPRTAKRPRLFDGENPDNYVGRGSHFFVYDRPHFVCYHGRCIRGKRINGWSKGYMRIGNVKKHIAWHHKDLQAILELEDFEEYKRRAIEARAAAVQRAKSIENRSAHPGTLHRYLSRTDESASRSYTGLVQTLYILCARISFRAGTSPYLKELIKTTSGRADMLAGYNAVCGDHLVFLYAALLSFLLKDFWASPGFSISFDGWSSRSQSKALMAVTYHYVDVATLHPQAVLLDVIPYSTELHTANAIAVSVGKRVDNRSMDEQILRSVTTDNAPNVIKAARRILSSSATSSLKEEDDDEEDEEESTDAIDNALGCMAHTLHLAVNDMLADASDISIFLTQVSQIVSATRRSVRRQNKLRQVQLDQGIQHPLRMVSAVSTRWNSLLAMAERMKVLWTPLAVMCVQGYFDCDRKCEVSLPTEEDTDRFCSALVRVLTPVRDLSTFVQGEQYFVAPHVPFLLSHLEESLKNIAETNDSRLAQSLASSLLRHIERRLESVFHPRSPLLLAAVMHPAHTKWVFRRLGSVDRAELVSALTEWMQEVDSAKQIRNVETAVTCESSWSTMEETTESVLVLYRREVLRHLARLEESCTGGSVLNAKEREESDVKFREAYQVDKNSLTTVLMVVLLSVSASSAAPERVFSCAGHLDGPLRSRLSEEKLEMSVVVSYNMARMSDSKRVAFLAHLRKCVEKGEVSI